MTSKSGPYVSSSVERREYVKDGSRNKMIVPSRTGMQMRRKADKLAETWYLGAVSTFCGQQKKERLRVKEKRDLRRE